MTASNGAWLSRKRVDGKFLGPGGTVPASQAVCSSLLEECFEIVQEIRAQDESKNVASSLRPIYDRLSEIRKELEQLVRRRLQRGSLLRRATPANLG